MGPQRVDKACHCEEGKARRTPGWPLLPLRGNSPSGNPVEFRTFLVDYPALFALFTGSPHQSADWFAMTCFFLRFLDNLTRAAHITWRQPYITRRQVYITKNTRFRSETGIFYRFSGRWARCARSRKRTGGWYGRRRTWRRRPRSSGTCGRRPDGQRTRRWRGAWRRCSWRSPS